MPKDIRILLVFLIIAIGVLVWLQCYNCNSTPSTEKINNTNIQPFTVENKYDSSEFKLNSNFDSSSNSIQKSNKIRGLEKKIEDEDKTRSSRESQIMTSKIVDNILKTEARQNLLNQETKFSESLGGEFVYDENSLFSENKSNLNNPLEEDINTDRNSLDSDQQVLDELIKEVNTGNDLIVNNPRSELYKNKSRSINSANKYRKVSYKDSEYRYDFNENGDPSQSSQDELNSLYDDSLVFRNNEYNTNSNFKGFNETSQSYGNANLNDFKPSGPQTQQEKVMSLYNSNEYLPNNNMLDKKLTKGFQILDNPVAVSNPNLIPVLKSIPVSSVMGSNRNATYDIRAEPPCPKTVVSPFLNSSIMPDIYATNRGCL